MVDAKRGRLVNCPNEWVVSPEGRCNPPYGGVEKLSDLLQQDLAYYGSRKGGGH